MQVKPHAEPFRRASFVSGGRDETGCGSIYLADRKNGMKKYFSKKGIVIGAIAVFIAVVAYVSVTLAGGPGTAGNIMNAITKPVRSVANSVVGAFEQFYGYMYEYDNIALENEKLKARIAELEQGYREYAEVYEENERLRDLLDLSTRNTDFVIDSASIISWSASNWSSAFSISKGSSNSDVAVGDCIITETGCLIGRITNVGDTTSTAITIIDTAFSAGALIEGGSEAAVAKGDFALMRKGLLKLDFLTDTTNLVAGDAIVTSGKGGALPKGLVVGYIEDVILDKTGLREYAEIKPAIDFDSLLNIFVITDFEVLE